MNPSSGWDPPSRWSALLRKVNETPVGFLAREKELCGTINGGSPPRPDSLTHLKDCIRPGSEGARRPQAAARHPQKNASKRGPTADPLHPADGGTRGAGRTTPGLYAEQIIRACYLDRSDPVGEWEAIRRTQPPSSSG